ncbi:MAG: DUF1080 domain-containing protein [Thermoguttaceae bacterium]
MKITRRLSLTLFAVALFSMTLFSVAAATAADDGADDGFVDIFNGKDLSGWATDGKKTYKEGAEKKPVWTVKDGIIKCAGKNPLGFLRYDKQLSDFILRIEYRMSPKCNSGLGIRGTVFTGPRATRPSMAGYELQVLDDSGRKPTPRSSGSLYRYVAPKVNASKPAGEWNTVEIDCRGPKIHITMNGQTLHDVDQSKIEAIKNKPLSGYFSVQNHGRVIEFRNVRLKEL